MTTKLGKTNDFPRGKFNQHDEGGLNIGIFTKDKTIIIDFGTPVKWIGLDKQTALSLATNLFERANKL